MCAISIHSQTYKYISAFYITFVVFNINGYCKGMTIWFWGGGGAGTFGGDRLFIFITGSAGTFISG